MNIVGRVLPVTGGETPGNTTGDVVHIDSYARHNWPPKAGDTQGIAYQSWLGRLMCKHEKIECFWWVNYRGGISAYKGHVCTSCGTITWGYREL